MADTLGAVALNLALLILAGFEVILLAALCGAFLVLLAAIARAIGGLLK